MRGIEIAFAGRSNVGKSSLINALTGRKALARTSHTPGPHPGADLLRGRPPALTLVDMPGYGYAAAPKDKVAGLDRADPRLPAGRANLARVYVLIDARHGLKDADDGAARRPRQGGGQLSGRADQGRPGEAAELGRTDRRDRGRAQASARPPSRTC